MCPILQPRIENGVQMAVGSISMMYFAEQITPKRHSLKQEFYFLWPRKSSIWAGLRWVILMKVIRSVQESKTASPIYLALWWGWRGSIHGLSIHSPVLRLLTQQLGNPRRCSQRLFRSQGRSCTALMTVFCISRGRLHWDSLFFNFSLEYKWFTMLH